MTTLKVLALPCRGEMTTLKSLLADTLICWLAIGALVAYPRGRLTTQGQSTKGFRSKGGRSRNKMLAHTMLAPQNRTGFIWSLSIGLLWQAKTSICGPTGEKIVKMLVRKMMKSTWSTWRAGRCTPTKAESRQEHLESRQMEDEHLYCEK
jgi:hypothetical protein